MPRWIGTLPALGAALLLALVPAGCSDDDSGTNTGGGSGAITLPASWAGTWQITSSQAPGVRGGVPYEINVSPLCSGLSIEDLTGTPDHIPEMNLNCTGSWTDDAADITCTGTWNAPEGGCTITYTYTLVLDRVGDTFAGTETETIDYSDECEQLDESSARDIDAIRISTDQVGCSGNLDDTLPASWGGVWDITVTPVERSARGEGELLCPGEDVGDVFDGGDEVSGGFTDTRAEVFTSRVSPAGNGCLEVRTNVFDLTRSGGTLTGTNTESAYLIDDPMGGIGECVGSETTEYTVSGTRISEDISGCNGRRLATEVRSWESGILRMISR